MRLDENIDELISVPFDPRLCYKFISKRPRLQVADDDVGAFLIGNSRQEYLQSKYYNHSRILVDVLMGGMTVNASIYIFGRNEMMVPKIAFDSFKGILQSAGLYLDDKIIGSLFLVREMLVPIFVEMQEEKFHLVDYRSGITEEYFTPAVYCDLHKQRPVEPEMQPYCDLIGAFYPHLFKLKGIKEEKMAIVLFGILLDTANFSQFIIEAEAKGKSVPDWLYRKVREKFYDFRNNWENPFKNRESTTAKRRKKQLPYFLDLFAFLTDLKERPDGPACELRISRTIANIVGIDRKSTNSIPESVIKRFTEYFPQYQPSFSRLGLWPNLQKSAD